MRLGIAHHFGWAVTASADHRVLDRRRIELIEPGVPSAPIHHRAGKATAVPGPMVSISLRAWPLDFPQDIAAQRRVPYEARADSVMYRQVLAELARARGWAVHLFDAKDVEARAVGKLGERADEILLGPRTTIGPP